MIGHSRRQFIAALATAAAWPVAAHAQSQKVARIGWVTAQRAPSLTPFVAAFRAGLADYGYVEGRNLTIAYRYADDVSERVPQLANELAQLPVDLIVAQGRAAFPISRLGLPLPVVFVYSGDPVTAGFAESLARPIRNMTGVTFLAADLNGKRLELLQQFAPGLKRVAIIANPEHPGEHLEYANAEEAGRQLGLTLAYFPTRTEDELNAAFRKMDAAPPQSISLFSDGFALQHLHRIVDFATKHRAPMICGWPVFAESGALCSYGPRITESYRRVGHYVDRILKGVKPADLPIEQPTQFQLVLNLRTAKALGLTVPPALLARADDIIE